MTRTCGRLGASLGEGNPARHFLVFGIRDGRRSDLSKKCGHTPRMHRRQNSIRVSWSREECYAGVSVYTGQVGFRQGTVLINNFNGL